MGVVRSGGYDPEHCRRHSASALAPRARHFQQLRLSMPGARSRWGCSNVCAWSRHRYRSTGRCPPAIRAISACGFLGSPRMCLPPDCSQALPWRAVRPARRVSPNRATCFAPKGSPSRQPNSVCGSAPRATPPSMRSTSPSRRSRERFAGLSDGGRACHTCSAPRGALRPSRYEHPPIRPLHFFRRPRRFENSYLFLGGELPIPETGDSGFNHPWLEHQTGSFAKGIELAGDPEGTVRLTRIWFVSRTMGTNQLKPAPIWYEQTKIN